jgi:hypothetical protein
MSCTCSFDAAFTDLKGGFDAVASWTEGPMRDLILQSSARLSAERCGSMVQLADTYGDLVDELEEQARFSPAATEALDNLNAAMSMAMARGMGM